MLPPRRGEGWGGRGVPLFLLRSGSCLLALGGCGGGGREPRHLLREPRLSPRRVVRVKRALGRSPIERADGFDRRRSAGGGVGLRVHEGAAGLDDQGLDLGASGPIARGTACARTRLLLRRSGSLSHASSPGWGW